MTEFEKLSDTCKIRWLEGYEIKTQKYTQVSGYIFNDKNQLLIIKSNVWTVPGGHPEKGETQLDTLNREVMEEACVTLKEIHYLGAVEVVENGETYYQLRYTAKVNEVLPFKQEWETCEREFANLDKLVDYIKWSKGITFSAQIESARKYWKF